MLSLGVAEYFGVEATPLLILFGIAVLLLPDIDVITLPFGTWYHRTFTHYPTVYIPPAVLAYVFLDPLYATIFTLGVYAHLIHDTVGIGWGVAWLWPFSKRKFLFFPWEGIPGDKKVFATWMPEQEPSLTEKQQNTDWLKDYFRPSRLAYIEYGVLLLALIVLVVHFAY